MPKLKVLESYALCGVSTRPGKDGQYQLKKLEGDAFNKPIDVKKITDRLTDLTNILYNFDKESQWFEIIGDMCMGETVSFQIDHFDRCFIPKIMDRLDVEEGVYRFFVIVNGKRTEYQWIVAVSLGKAYLG